MKVYEVIHTSPEIKTVYDYVTTENSAALKYAENVESFLLVKNTKGETNRQVIEATYTTSAEKRAYKGKDARTMLIKVGTRLAIEFEKINKSALLTEGLEIVSYNVPAFKAHALAELESKDGYTVEDFAKPINGTIKKAGTVRVMYPDETVWIWCRSLANANNNYEGEIFNVTPFVESVSTDVGKNGGNFEIKLPPLVCELNDKNQWVIKKKSIQFYMGRNLSMQKSDYVAEANIHEDNEGTVRSSFLFHNIIGSNDLVFIRFETLKVEADQRITDAEKLYVSKSNLPKRVYDMIGLVDSNSQVFNPSNTDVSINIVGRDLMKLFIEDGTYVYNQELTKGMLGGPGSVAGNGGITDRLASDKSTAYLGLFFNNSIENTIKFVINQLSNIKVVPDTLFDAYGDRRNKRLQDENAKSDEELKSDKKVGELEKQAKKAIGDIRKIAKLSKSSPEAEKVKVTELFIELKRFLQAVRSTRTTDLEGYTNGWKAQKYRNKRGVNEPLDEDTYPVYFATDLFGVTGTEFVLDEAVKATHPIDEIIDLETSKPNYTAAVQRKPAPGIWQIIKLVLDEQVTSRRAVDSSLSSANGSLLNYFHKVCQEPFVEFYGDTYGDMYHIIARKPPTDKVGVVSMLNGQVVTENVFIDNEGNEEARIAKVTPTIIDIEESDVLMENLSFDDTEAYSWYHLTPQSNFQGGDQFALAYLPAIFLQEYADIWGSRPMQIQHNYMPALTSDNTDKREDKVYRQAVEDLRYVIQSCAHLPFTRKGMIKTNGDRRFKVGNLVRYKPTGEIFLIDHVKQDFSIGESSIDRTSTIQVSRGMIEQLIYGISAPNPLDEASQGYISYFNIVQTTPVFEYKDSTSVRTEQVQVGQREVITSKGTRVGNAVGASSIPSDVIIQQGNTNMWVLREYNQSSYGRMVQLINAINAAGYWVTCKNGDAAVRTFNEQAALHRENKQNARPGHSRHETGLAIDINIIHKVTKIHYTKSFPKSAWLATGIPQLAKSLGFSWGGDFKNYHDPIHFEIVADSDGVVKTMEPIMETRKISSTHSALDTNKIFSNFKVNRHVFDFFLRKEQMDKRYRKVSDKSSFDDTGSRVLDNVTVETSKK